MKVSVPFLVSLLCTVLFAGCVMQSREYLGRAPVSVHVDGREFRVWSRREGSVGHVQVVRMGYVRRSGHGGLSVAMVTAAEQATGCNVILSSVEGDTGVINARIRCSD